MSTNRRQKAMKVRVSAAELAANRVHPRHVANGDEQKFRRKDGSPSYLASFTKGLPHNHETGLICDPEDFQQFVRGIDSGDPRDFVDTPLGPKGYPCTCTGCACEKTEQVSTAKTDPEQNSSQEDPSQCGCTGERNKEEENCCPCVWKSEKGRYKNKVRAWESQGGGNTFDLEGPDAQAVTMPPAPALGSDELIAEMAEVYAQALLRDVPFTEITDCSGDKVNEIIETLNKLDWINTKCGLTPAEDSRRRKVNPKTGLLDGQTVFRGITPGDEIGPYISQFLLVGNKGLMDAHNPCEGRIAYGSITIDQRVRKVHECDFMTTWNEWFDVQNGADLRGDEQYEKKGKVPTYRFITTPRDLATYVHYDALYEAYLNACLIMLGDKVPFDPGIPFQREDIDDHQQGFAHFGGPHILSLVTEVATRALKAVRFQKFNVHRRMRPEVLAARLTRYNHLKPEKFISELSEEELGKLNSEDVKIMEENEEKFRTSGLDVLELGRMVGADGLKDILTMVGEKNSETNCDDNELNYLLPMAFPEGSPMHPAYGAGHATVAGACVTILKAFFDHSHPLRLAGDDKHAFVPCGDGSYLECVKIENGSLTVEGELNKLASNISIGRDWAGVHYFSDYIESLRMGEQIAIGILEEQKLTYGENFSMTIPLFDGGTIRI